ncbi:MAG: MoaD/ThiS family protein [Bacteroidota bacterium]
MVRIKFTQALKRFYPDLQTLELEVNMVSEVIQGIEDRYPGIRSYILDDQGQVRKHVNIFVDGKMINDREQLSDSLAANSEVYIMQALSGG